MKCTVQVRIRRLKGGWTVADPEDRSKYVHVLPVKLSIVEAPKGYHLVMSPEGCFTADAFSKRSKKPKMMPPDALASVMPIGWWKGGEHGRESRT